MKYPTRAEVEAADRLQLARWWRFLPSPGENALPYRHYGQKSEADFDAAMDAEVAIMDRIARRFNEYGGMSPEISKAIGWDKA